MYRGSGNPRALRNAAPSTDLSYVAKRIEDAFGKYETALQKDKGAALLQPLPAKRQRQLEKYLDSKIAYFTQVGDEQMVSALKHYMVNAMMKAEEAKISEDYHKSFLAWLLGQGKASDHARTPWGREPHALELPSVQRVLEQILEAMYITKTYLIKLIFRAPQTLGEYAIYYKYILHCDDWMATEDAWIFLDFPALIEGAKWYEGESGLGRVMHGEGPPRIPPGQYLNGPPKPVRSGKLRDLLDCIENTMMPQKPQDPIMKFVHESAQEKKMDISEAEAAEIAKEINDDPAQKQKIEAAIAQKAQIDEQARRQREEEDQRRKDEEQARLAREQLDLQKAALEAQLQTKSLLTPMLGMMSNFFAAKDGPPEQPATMPPANPPGPPPGPAGQPVRFELPGFGAGVQAPAQDPSPQLQPRNPPGPPPGPAGQPVQIPDTRRQEAEALKQAHVDWFNPHPPPDPPGVQAKAQEKPRKPISLKRKLQRLKGPLQEPPGAPGQVPLATKLPVTEEERGGPQSVYDPGDNDETVRQRTGLTQSVVFDDPEFAFEDQRDRMSWEPTGPLNHFVEQAFEPVQEILTELQMMHHINDEHVNRLSTRDLQVPEVVVAERQILALEREAVTNRYQKMQEALAKVEEELPDLRQNVMANIPYTVPDEQRNQIARQAEEAARRELQEKNEYLRQLQRIDEERAAYVENLIAQKQQNLPVATQPTQAEVEEKAPIPLVPQEVLKQPKSKAAIQEEQMIRMKRLIELQRQEAEERDNNLLRAQKEQEELERIQPPVTAKEGPVRDARGRFVAKFKAPTYLMNQPEAPLKYHHQYKVGTSAKLEELEKRIQSTTAQVKANQEAREQNRMITYGEFLAKFEKPQPQSAFKPVKADAVPTEKKELREEALLQLRQESRRATIAKKRAEPAGPSKLQQSLMASMGSNQGELTVAIPSTPQAPMPAFRSTTPPLNREKNRDASPTRDIAFPTNFGPPPRKGASPMDILMGDTTPRGRRGKSAGALGSIMDI